MSNWWMPFVFIVLMTGLIMMSAVIWVLEMINFIIKAIRREK